MTWCVRVDRSCATADLSTSELSSTRLRQPVLLTPLQTPFSTMSRNFPGEQYEQDFIPHRLCNWEVPAVKRTSAATMYGTLNPRREATTAIANDRGYLLSKKSKFSDSFNHNNHVYDTSAARWPKPNPLVNTGAHATMGYKGILTTYLNASTVSIPSVDIPGCKERNFH